jgi:fatty acid desaturase
MAKEGKTKVVQETKKDEIDAKRLEQARKVAKNKISFIRHAITYLIVMAVLAAINNVTFGGYQWWLWPALGWGIGLAFHFAESFVFSGMNMKRLEEELTRKELERMKHEE